MAENKKINSEDNEPRKTDALHDENSQTDAENPALADASENSENSEKSKNSDTSENSETTENEKEPNEMTSKSDIKDKKPKKSFIKNHKKSLITLSLAVIVAASAYSIYVTSYDKIMPGTYIENIKLSGMTQEEAESVLSSIYTEDKIQDKTINFSCKDSTSNILVKNLAIEFKPAQMASDAYSCGREKDGFFSKLKSFTMSLFNKNQIRPAMDYDTQALTGAISDICSPYEIEPLGYTYRIADPNSIVIAKPRDGIKVDMEEAVKTVEDEICSFTFGDIEFVPMSVKAPKLNLDEFYNYIVSPATDAYYAKDENNKVYVVPGKPQVVVNKSDIENAVNQSLSEYTVPVQTVNSAVTTEFLESILYSDILGTYSTNYGGSSAARASNIQTASKTIDGVELLPGERFDFNKIVGERKASTGYLPAPVYVVKNGETVSEIDYGGGICQVSSTIYCAVSRAKLRVINRVSHSKGVSYVPQGMDATVSWGGPEFIFENSTNYPIKINITASGGIVTVKISGSVATKPIVRLESETDGSSVSVTKITTNADGSETTEHISSNRVGDYPLVE